MRKLLLLFFEYFYHQFAWTYDFVANFVSIGRWNDWRNVALPYTNGLNVLEIGFGTGHLQVELARRNTIALGLDESWQMAGIASANIRHHKFTPKLLCGKAQFLPFADNSFETIVITFPSNYISDKRTLAELIRVLKPSACLIVIPMARIIGKTHLDQAARWLFKITGQVEEQAESLENRLITLFSEPGFSVRIINEQTRQSIVTLIIAVKPDSKLDTKTYS